MPSERIPKICRHKATQQAYVTLNGQEHYLGSWPAGKRKPPPTVQAQYEALISRWLAHGRRLPEVQACLSVNEVVLAYLRWAHEYYSRDGKPNAHYVMVRDALRVVTGLYGKEAAETFGPKKLKAVQNAMVQLGWSRNYVNEQVNRVRRMFKWAVAEELVSGSLFHALQAVSGLRKGTPGIRETDPVKPVAEAVVEVTLPFLPPVVRAMVQTQLLTGMRPGETCIMRACDIDMFGAVWLYRPAKHKTEHHGQDRVVPIGPRAQEIIRSWLKLDTQAYLFNPTEAEAARNNERRRQRQTPMTPSHGRRKPKRSPKRPKRDHYDETSYRNAVYRACDRAFPAPVPLAKRPDETRNQWEARLTDDEKAERDRWQKEHRWHPNQLRHTAGTNIRRAHGIEMARIILGHSRAFTTEIYAEVDQAQAVEVMAKLG